MKPKTLYYGGSFDPVGLHHLALAQLAMEAGGYEEVVFIPCYEAPHKGGLASYEHRAQMLRLAVGYEGSRLSVSHIEKELFEVNGRRSCTIETVRELKKRGNEEVHLLVGMDSITNLPTWHEWETLVEEAHLVVARRHGRQASPETSDLSVIDLSLPLISGSSTMIRERVRDMLPINFLVPAAVDRYIAQNCLYRSLEEGVKHVG